MTDAARDAARVAFIAEAGWGDAACAPLAGDASNRRYFRLTDPQRHACAVLMDSPSSNGEDISVFLAMTDHLRGLGLSAPEILHADIPTGFALLEDLGDDLYARVCAHDPGAQAALYGAAVDILARLHRMPAPARVGSGAAVAEIPLYELEFMVSEAVLALDWWRRAVTGAAPEPALTSQFSALIEAACAGPLAAPRILTLRDYHAENLIWLPERTDERRVGLLDYQGAMAGARAYDLVSLLEDARRDTTAELRRAMIRRYLAASGLDAAGREAFAAGYAALGAQRNLKILGLFARLHLRDGKPGYLGLIPRVWAHIQRDLAHPALDELRRLVEAELPSPDEATLARVRSGGA